MTKKKLIEMYEQLEVSLYRTEKSRKDVDLLVALRCIFYIVDFMLKGGFYELDKNSCKQKKKANKYEYGLYHIGDGDREIAVKNE